MSNLDHHLWLRDGVYYCRMRLGSKQLVESLRTSDKAEARVLRSAVLKRWNRARYLDPDARAAAFARPAPAGSEPVSVDRLLDVYREVAAERCRVRGKPRAQTVVNNCSAFRRVFGNAVGIAEVIAVDALRRYAQEATADAEDELEMIRARVSAGSTIAQALSVVAEWTEDEYRRKGIRLPAAVAEVRRADVVSVNMPQYVLTDERKRLRAATEAAAAELAVADPALYSVYLLAYMGGLRAGEIAHSRWSWLSNDAGGECWLVVPRAEREWRVKSKPGSVRLAPAVWEWLQAQRGESDYVLPGATATAREDVLERFSAWMRKVGWDRERFPKSTHELRKLAGVRWYSEHGAETAAKWLRDNLVTVLRFYADLDPSRQPDPVTPEVARI